MELGTMRPVGHIRSRHYLKKMIFTYSTVVYSAVLLTGLLFLIYIQYGNARDETVRQDAYFDGCVETYEGMLEDFFAITSNLKEMNQLDLFALAGERSYYQKMTEFQQELETFAVPYRRQGFGFAIQREGEELVVTETNSTKLKYLLRDWGLSEQQYAGAVHSLTYTGARDHLIFTDSNIFYMTTKNYMNKHIYILCHLPAASVELPNYDDNTTVCFWSDDTGIQDLRQQQYPELEDGQARSLTQLAERGAVSHYRKDHVEYRLRLSDYYDIVYCGMTQRGYAELVIGIILALLCALVPIYGVVYLVTRQISCRMYQPIEDLTNTVRAIPGGDEPDGNELLYIADRVRSMQSQNDELQKRLDSLTADIQQGISDESLPEAAAEPDTLKEQLETYVLEHLSEDISLYDIAENFGLSFHYMSVVFKNKMDHNFKEYLSYQRYVRALALMQENPKMKIADIAAQVGIANVNTFIRIFKKYSGTTPKQYTNTLL